MKINVFKNHENYIIRDYDLSNCSVEEIENALDLHCESVGVDPDKAAVAIVEEDGWGEKETIIKGTSTNMSMIEVAVELLKQQEHGQQKENKKNSFANGYEYFCVDCGEIFSASFESDDIDAAKYCPYCGEHFIVHGTKEILENCIKYNVDPVKFSSVFPPDELIPQSRTGATPRQVSIILDLVSMRRHKGLPLSVNDVAGPCDTHIDIVKKVFEELHITEIGGEE